MAENKIKTVSNVDWHSGFYGAIGLEFIENDDDITLIDEHRLNHQPIRIDLLVVKKNREIQIANELGAAFRGHNIMEYKSEDDIWLSNLRKDIPEPTFRDVIIRMHGFTTKQERAYAKAYFGALAEYND